MRLNILFARRAVQSALDRPDGRIALVLVLLPLALSALGAYWFGVSLAPMALLVNAVKSVLSWILLGVIVYVLAYLVSGKRVKGKFSGILCAVSLLWILSLLATLAGFVLVPFLFDEPIRNVLRMGANGELTPQQTGFEVQRLLEQSPQPFNFNMALGVFGIGIVLVIWALFLLYVLFSDLLSESRILTKLLLTAVAVVLWFNGGLLWVNW